VVEEVEEEEEEEEGFMCDRGRVCRGMYPMVLSLTVSTRPYGSILK
jgi:hypothetical protein